MGALAASVGLPNHHPERQVQLLPRRQLLGRAGPGPPLLPFVDPEGAGTWEGLVMPNAEGHALISELAEDEQMREVYARFGLTVYFAQVFEAGAVNVIVLQDIIDGKVQSAEGVDEHFDRLFAAVLGRHVGTLADRLAAEDVQLCRQALAERNRLAHRYWREEIEKTATEEGRQSMVDDLDVARDLFMRADDALERVVYRIGEPVGVTSELVQEMVEEMRQGTPLSSHAVDRPPLP